MTPPAESILTLPLGGRKLSPQQWARVEKLLDEWKTDVLKAARKHPARSYQLGVQQIEAFADLLAGLRTETGATGAFGGVSATMRSSEAWARRYTLHELEDALNVYVGKIKDALLYGLAGGLNSTQIASMMYRATQDATVNWRMIARTEAVRANAMGRLDACEQMGFDRVWCPPHIGSCKKCKRLLEGRDFLIKDVRDATNFGRPAREWVACIPLHPNCRHSWLPYDAEVVAEARAQYARMEAAGLTDEDRLDDLFDSSGQLRADADPAQFDMLKAFDWAAEGLAAAVYKTARDTGWGEQLEHVERDEIRTDLYQRALDPDKVLDMLAALRRGEQLAPPVVSRRADGSVWCLDGQHRIEAHRLNGDPVIECLVRTGMSWGQEADECRHLIGKVLDPLATAVISPEPAPVPVQAASLEDALHQLAQREQPDEPAAPALNPALFDGLRPRTACVLSFEAWWSRIAGPQWPLWSTLYISATGQARVLVDYPALREHRAAWRKLTDNDLHLALMLAARGQITGVDLAPGLPLDVRIEPHQQVSRDSWAREFGPLWDVSAGTWIGGTPAGVAKLVGWAWQPYRPDELPWGAADRLIAKDAGYAAPMYHVTCAEHHESIMRDGLHHGHGDELPDDEQHVGNYLFHDRADASRYGRRMAADTGQPVHLYTVETDGLDLESDPQPGFAEEHGTASFTTQPIPPARVHHDGTTFKTSDDTDVTKATEAAANTGVEHWITVHPHGDSEPGQPVLVRNNSDGTMTVIGGAGGNMNYVRLDPSRRIGQGTGRRKADGGSKVEQALTPEESERKQAEREQELAAARDQIAQAKERRAAVEQQLHDYLREHVGIDPTSDDLDGKQRRKLMAKVRTSALRTLAYGPVTRRDLADGADGAQLAIPDAPKDPRTAEQAAADAAAVQQDASTAGEDGLPRTPRPQVALTEDDARAVLDMLHDMSAISRVAGNARKVVAGDKSAANANQIDWSLGGQLARDERRAAAVEQTIRTDQARSLLEHAENPRKKSAYDTAFKQGAFDSVDAFTHTILGRAMLSREGADLLGVSGAAQLVAYHIQTQAQELGKKGLDLDKVQAALKELSDDQEAAIVDRGLARVKKAADEATEATTELGKSEKGESLWTTTMARSTAATKINEASRGLGAMLGGLEALGAMKVALDRKAGEKVKVGGFSSPARIKELAAKARIQVRDSDITRVGAGNYTLSIEAERLEKLMRPEPKVDQAYRDRLEQIRTGKDLDAEIEAARTGPGMSDTLDANQAKGKMFLQTAGSGILGFDPGVGKTHTAIAAAMELMHKEPDAGHRALIVAPTNMLRSWASTIESQGSGHTVQIVGQSDTSPDKDTSDRGKKVGQLTGGADFTIVSYESLKSYRKDLKDHAAANGAAHSIVIADELQKAKNEDTGNHGAVEDAVRLASHHNEGNSHFWGLTGTPIEKDVSDLHSMVRLTQIAKGEDPSDRKTVRAKYGKLGQDEHIARGDKIRQFRQGLDEHLFRLSAEAAGNDLPEPTREHHEVKLDDEHREQMLQTTQQLNEQIADYHRRTKEGLEGGVMPSFGGRDALLDALYGREDSALTRQAADIVDGLGTFEFGGMSTSQKDGNYAKGDHAGTYEHKSVIFGSNELSKALFGKEWRKGKKGGLHAELERRGIKVFIGHGGMSNAQNDANYKAFLAHGGKAVFLTNDKNNAGISLQFGDNKGQFQHGATHMIHFTRPVNNATIQQREARVLRKGTEAPVTYHTISADTPVERRLQEALDREKRTQDLAANSEQQVAGSDTLAHHLEARGVTPGLAARQARQPREKDKQPA